MPVGPEGRTPADIQGKPFLSKAERDWFFTMFGPGGAPVTTSRGTPNSTVTPPSTGNAGLANTTELQSYALNSAVQNGLDPTLFSSLITHESGWDPRAVNPDSGAAGLGQFLPSTAATFGTTPDELRSNPRKALDLAATKLGGLKKMFGDDAMALAAYYVGEGTVGDAVRNNPQNWVQELDRLARERYKLTGQNAPSAFLSSVGAFRAVPTMGGR